MKKKDTSEEHEYDEYEYDEYDDDELREYFMSIEKDYKIFRTILNYHLLHSSDEVLLNDETVKKFYATPDHLGGIGGWYGKRPLPTTNGLKRMRTVALSRWIEKNL